MKKEKIFLILLLGQIFLVSFSYLLVVEYVIRRYIIPIDYDMKSFNLYKKTKSPNIIWGDSQTMEGINNLEGFVNLSFGADTYQEIEIKIKNFYKSRKFSTSKKAILLLGLNGFGETNNRKNRNLVKEMFLSKNEKPFLYISKKYFQKRASGYLKNFISNGFKVVPFKNMVINKDGSISKFRVYNSSKLNQNKKNTFKKLSEKVEQETTIYGLIEDSVYDLRYEESPNYLALLRIIEFFENENISSCFITTPRHKNYRMKMRKYNSFADLKSFFKDLSAKKNIAYLDFSQLDYPESFFSDPKHLNYKGAKEFTALVKKSCSVYF